MTDKKKDYLLNTLKLPDEVVSGIDIICSTFGAEKYAVWLGKEAKKDASILSHERMREVFDWIQSTRPDILAIDFETALVRSREFHDNLAKLSENVVNYKGVDKSRVLFQCSDNKHFFYILDVSELKDEGKMMGHCVGTNKIYAVRIKAGELKIISLRDEHNQAHVTIEIDLVYGNTGQISGKSNAAPVSKYNDLITEFGIYMATDTMNEEDMETIKKLAKK